MAPAAKIRFVKTWFSICLAFCLCYPISGQIKPVSAQIAQASPEKMVTSNSPIIDGLVGEYLFNEGYGSTIIDTSGYHRNGVNHGANWVSSPIIDNSGDKNYAVQLNQSYIEFPTDILKHIPLSISLWMKAEQNVNDTRTNLISNDLPSSGGHGIGINKDGYIIVEVESNNAQSFHNTSYKVNWGRWYHIVAVYETGQVNVYVNTTLVDTYTYSQGILNAEDRFLLGRHNFDDKILGEKVFFNGKVDSLRIFQKALTPDEILKLYGSVTLSSLSFNADIYGDTTLETVEYPNDLNFYTYDGFGTNAYIYRSNLTSDDQVAFAINQNIPNAFTLHLRTISGEDVTLNLPAEQYSYGIVSMPSANELSVTWEIDQSGYSIRLRRLSTLVHDTSVPNGYIIYEQFSLENVGPDLTLTSFSEYLHVNGAAAFQNRTLLDINNPTTEGYPILAKVYLDNLPLNAVTNGNDVVIEKSTNNLDIKNGETKEIGKAGYITSSNKNAEGSQSEITGAADQLINSSSFLTGKITNPGDLSTIGPSSLEITADASYSGGAGVKEVSFYVFYDREWHWIGTDSSCPYAVTWNIPTSPLLQSQTIKFRIDVVGNDETVVQAAGGPIWVYYLSSSGAGGSSVIENWIPSRGYLNQRSLYPCSQDNCPGDTMSGASSMAMLMAMNGVIDQGYPVMAAQAIEMYPNISTGNLTYLKKMRDVLNTRTGYPSEIKGPWDANKAWSFLMSEIDDAHPVIVFPRPGRITPKGHFVVGVGYWEPNGSQGKHYLIAYDPYGRWLGKICDELPAGCSGNYDRNTSSPYSHKGEWVFYDFDAFFGNSDGYLITLEGLTTPELSHPNLTSSEAIDPGTYSGSPVGDAYKVHLPWLAR